MGNFLILYCKHSNDLKLCSKLKMNEEYRYMIFFFLSLILFFFSVFVFFSIFSIHSKRHVQPLSAVTAYFMFWKVLPEWPPQATQGPIYLWHCQKTISRMFVGQELLWNRECLTDLLHGVLFSVCVCCTHAPRPQSKARKLRKNERMMIFLAFETLLIALSIYALSSPLSHQFTLQTIFFLKISFH